MQKAGVIGIDMGATNMKGAVVSNGVLSAIATIPVKRQSNADEVLADVYKLVDGLLQTSEVAAIGIGVPSMVNVNEGIVYDVVNIPAWKEVPLKRLLEQRFGLPVYVNNDANCFAAGEYYYGKGVGFNSMVGLTLGTGLGAGVIINKQLYEGYNCGAGEFGLLPYADSVLDEYASGSFFTLKNNIDGKLAYGRACEGDTGALALYRQFGKNLGHAIKMVMYTFDPGLIVLGGSVRVAYDYFKDSMWEEIRTYVYPAAVKRLKIEVSALENSGILGAAALPLIK
ncbi:ROK family protein [Mucilaginibacter sp. 44-25]|uniref:ROK family protein n=1 Tax=Mucilaginibacter sp. 44-25 TaxID=1895794 RepID=UPI00095DF43F|nr:ROK family protein [Mucilaginibacter sp. 44-25]OJW17473.1 MAG: sugar kinase [Mucilaginibacter sp. 44-25]